MAAKNVANACAEVFLGGNSELSFLKTVVCPLLLFICFDTSTFQLSGQSAPRSKPHAANLYQN